MQQTLPPKPTKPAEPTGWKPFLRRWVITVLAVLVAETTVSGIEYRAPADLMLAALLLGTLNAVVRPIMMFLSLPLLIFSLGLFMVVINAALIYFVGWVLEGFTVVSFWAAVKGAIVISVVSVAANFLLGVRNASFQWQIQRGPRRKQPPRGGPPEGPGPIIDV